MRSRTLVEGTELGEVTARQREGGPVLDSRCRAAHCWGGGAGAGSLSESLQWVDMGLAQARDPKDSRPTLKAEGLGRKLHHVEHLTEGVSQCCDGSVTVPERGQRLTDAWGLRLAHADQTVLKSQDAEEHPAWLHKCPSTHGPQNSTEPLPGRGL